VAQHLWSADRRTVEWARQRDLVRTERCHCDANAVWLRDGGKSKCVPHPRGEERSAAQPPPIALVLLRDSLLRARADSLPRDQIYDRRTSAFCSNALFQDDEFRSFGYWNDLHYHAFVGYGSKVAPYLGAQWLNVSTHNLLSAYAPKHPHPDPIPTTLLGKLAAFFKSKLPAPTLPPDATHTQLLFPYFTHREEPPVALVALGLWNTTTEQLPTDSMPKDRLWKTSHLLPFLGHVAIERLSCDAPPQHSSLTTAARGRKEEYIRVMVNGAPQPLGECQDGPGGSCKMDEFAQFVERRMELYGDISGACKKEEEA
jgi:acid phosphatase